MAEFNDPTEAQKEDPENHAATTQEQSFPKTAVAIAVVAILILVVVLVSLARRHG